MKNWCMIAVVKLLTVAIPEKCTTDVSQIWQGLIYEVFLSLIAKIYRIKIICSILESIRHYNPDSLSPCCDSIWYWSVTTVYVIDIIVSENPRFLRYIFCNAIWRKKIAFENFSNVYMDKKPCVRNVEGFERSKRLGICQTKYIIYQLLHQYHKILAACNIQGEWACEVSFNIAQSQHFVVLMKYLLYRMAQIFCCTAQWLCWTTVGILVTSYCNAYSSVYKLKWTHFQFYGFPWQHAIFVSVQHRKIWHTCITLIYTIAPVRNAQGRLIGGKRVSSASVRGGGIHKFSSDMQSKVILRRKN